ncbi:MAG: substrate-binding domain-containing protein [Tabrizicola sp.]|nr:substrate-binding domain-containing protein [Tabrizicola sp.]
MKRPTIPDLAAAAGVSVATVNRVISEADSVRQATRERVLQAAEEIGFYGIRTIENSVKSSRGSYRIGVLLHQGNRTFYRNLGDALRRAAEQSPDGKVDLKLEFLDDLSPETIATRLIALGTNCDSVALVAAEHPMISDAIDSVLASGTPVTGLIAPLSARGNVCFVGLDNWKVGRTAAWAFDRMVREPGKIGILVGNHRYRNQELNESGFRSYMREHNSAFTLLEPRATYESSNVAREITEEMLAEHPDLCGLFISGGGITGALAALRAHQRRNDFVAVGYELFDATRAALIDGTLNFVISHPMETFAREAVATMVRAKKAGTEVGALNVTLGFEIYTPENV